MHLHDDWPSGRVIGDWMEVLGPRHFGAGDMDWGLWRLSLVWPEAAVIPWFRELSVDGARSRYELSSPI